MPSYLENHLNQYFADITEALNGENPLLGNDFVQMLKEQLPFLKDVSNRVIDISRKHHEGFIKSAYDVAYALFDMLAPQFLSQFSWNQKDGWFYRIRPGDFRIKNPSESIGKKKELFHIKDDLRNFISGYRYSVSGFPCLYLSSGRELAWFECGMPRKFSYCIMAISEGSENALRLIDFSQRPVELLSNIHVWLANASKNQDKDEINRIYEYFVNYIITYPVAAACSLKVKSRGSKFIEEYVIPQLLMQWIRETDFFDGVRYKSSFYSNLVGGMGAINIALSVERFREDGLCEKLTSRIEISDIGYMDVDEEFKKYNEHLAKVERFRDALWSNVTSSDIQGEHLWRFIDLCETVIKTYDALINGSYQNTELLFSYIDCLSDYIHSIRISKDTIVQKYLKSAEQERIDPKTVDTQPVIAQVEELCTLLNSIIRKHTVFDFQFENLSNFEKI